MEKENIMSFNWYIAGSGKNQKMYDFLSERIPTIGYTDNKDVNLFVAARRMYLDAHANYGQRLDKELCEDFGQYISPVMPNFALGSPDDYRYGRREEALNLLERELDRVMEYLEDKYLGFASYELWFNEKTGGFYTSLDQSKSAPVGSDWHREIFGSEEDMRTWLQGREDIWRKHQALLGHLVKAKEGLRELGAGEDVKLLEEIVERLSKT